jgi:hypothetical protein
MRFKRRRFIVERGSPKKVDYIGVGEIVHRSEQGFCHLRRKGMSMSRHIATTCLGVGIGLIMFLIYTRPSTQAGGVLLGVAISLFVIAGSSLRDWLLWGDVKHGSTLYKEGILILSLGFFINWYFVPFSEIKSIKMKKGTILVTANHTGWFWRISPAELGPVGLDMVRRLVKGLGVRPPTPKLFIYPRSGRGKARNPHYGT